jgi:hypothetical protein
MGSGTYWVELNLENCLARDSVTVFYADNSSSFIEIEACDSFVSPSTSYVYFESGVYTDTIPNSELCDSIISIDLSITNLNLPITQEGFLLSANESGATYQWLDCNNAFEAMEGEIGQDFLVIENGSYAVEISKNGCVDTSECISVMSVGIVDYDFKDVTFYPNPSRGEVTIELGDLIEVSVEVISMEGKLIYFKEDISGPKYKFEFATKPGIYILMISSGDRKGFFKLVKKD